MTAKFFPEALFEHGFTDLVSVIPPGAELTPSSRIPQSAVGKVPGRRNANGTWGGYDWRKHEPTLDDVRKWCIDGANIGLRSDRFPCVDIDCTDEGLAKIIEDFALAKLGCAPIRVGRAPKRLLMYRTAEPFGRMRLFINKDGTHHLVEVLGQGQQYVVHGTHPSTLKPYTWSGYDMASVWADGLVSVTREQATEFLDELANVLGGMYVVEREGDGRPISRAVVEQSGLLAPSLEVLREAVDLIPNNNDLFPSRTDYLRMGYAIRAAGFDDEEQAYNIFAEWAAKWDGNAREKSNKPDVVLADWRRFRAPYSVGWNWIAEQARGFGFFDASLEFEVTSEAPAPTEKSVAPIYGSDQWLAERVASKLRGVVRYSPEKNSWLVWDRARWQIDAELVAEDIIKRELRAIADEFARRGSTEKELAQSEKDARAICSAFKLAQVMALVKSDRSIAVTMAALDHDRWILNTAQGIVDLKTGELLPSNPDALCTKITKVPADFSGACPEWKRFLAEATGGDREVEAYLQRLCGYALTGSTREQHLTFIHGPGGNGKGTFLNTVANILGDYHGQASMDTFTMSFGDKHSTDLAALVGKRLVTASETAEGKRWDEARVKSLTGGDPVTARFMRQDNFTFMPQFKLVFIGNHRPEVRHVDDAMKRRMQLVPFTIKPARVDKELDEKLREEAPAILAWMIDGCLAWQQHGLNPPQAVRVATEEYFESEDAVGRWLEDCVVLDAETNATSQELQRSYVEWANANGEYAKMSVKKLSSALIARGFTRWKHPDRDNRRAGFAGVRVENRQDLEAML